MQIKVRVTPSAREVRVTKISEDSYEVKVDERADGGRANKRLLEILSKHFKVPKSKVFIMRGIKSRDKIVEITL